MWAKTKYPNTAETDQQEQVMHQVFKGTVLVWEGMAADPFDAITKAGKEERNLHSWLYPESTER